MGDLTTRVRRSLQSDKLTPEQRLDISTLCLEADRLEALINNPHTDHFMDAVRTEAAHQREIGRDIDDVRKTAGEWFWTLGWLASKAVHSEGEKRLHHIITSAAMCLNWHRHTKAGADG